VVPAADGFRQADGSITRSHGRLGLGLAMVRHLVEAHGGRVHAASEGRGCGSTFRVMLPKRGAPTPVPPGPPYLPEPTASTEARLVNVRVLIVDDQADARELFELVLTQHGAEVLTVASADAALRAIAPFEPHILVSDISMPGDDGITLINRVRALGSPRGLLPAIATTSYARPEEVRAALGAGYTRHLAKPILPSVLANLVASLAGRK
jgi:CheY-like chemotaxis protein